MAASQLVIRGVQVQTPDGPVQQADIDAFYAKLEMSFAPWPKAMSTYMREEMEIFGPEDLVAAFRTDRDWDRFNDAQIKDPANQDKNVSRGARARVLRAFQSIKEADDRAAKQRQLGEDSADLDVMLDAKDLKEMCKSFWTRHKMIFKGDEMPGDQLLSRIVREMERRFLHNTDVLKVKGVNVERRAQGKHKALGDTGLYRKEDAAEVVVQRPQTAPAYLSGLRMYMQRLAIWVSKQMDPQPRDAENRESKPEKYVNFPWQFAYDYCHRARKFADDALEELPAKDVFQMVKKRDEEERDIWVDEIRNSENRTLGEIFRVTYERREERWTFDKSRRSTALVPYTGGGNQDGQVRSLTNTIAQLKQANAALRSQAFSGGGGGGKAAGKQGSPTGKSKGGKGAGAKRPLGNPVVLATLRNGTKLCQDYQWGKCKEPCPQGELHKCAGKVTNAEDIACGRGHPAMSCTRCERT